MSNTVPSQEGAVVVRLVLSPHALRDPLIALPEAMAQVAAASELESGTLVMIAGTAAGPERGLLGQLTSIGPRGQIHRATRCTCLLAKGYVQIAGGIDQQRRDWVWGYVP